MSATDGFDETMVIRTPSGTSEGGRFTNRTHQEDPDVTLEERDGSFFFPPPMKSVEDVLEFWTEVRIPDVALNRARVAQRDYYDNFLNGWPERSWSERHGPNWLAENPEPETGRLGKGRKEHETWASSKKRAHEDYIASARRRVAESQKMDIPSADVRAAVRAAGIVVSTKGWDLSEDESETLLSHRFQTGDGPRAVSDLKNIYPLDTYAKFVLRMQAEDDPYTASTQMKQTVDKAIASANRSISAQVRDFHEDMLLLQNIDPKTREGFTKADVKRGYVE